MNSKTQMIRIKSSKLFYWFRRVFGLFSLFVFGDFYAQMASSNNVVVSKSSDRNPVVYISEGTTIYDAATPEKPIEKRTANIIRKAYAKRKKNSIKAVLANKNLPQLYCQYHCNPYQSKDFMASSSILKSAFTSSNEHYNNFLSLSKIWQFQDCIDFHHSKIFIYTDNNESKNIHHKHKIRPPPDLM